MISKMHTICGVPYHAVEWGYHLRDVGPAIVRIEVEVEGIDMAGGLLNEDHHARRGIVYPTRGIGGFAEQPCRQRRDIVIRGQGNFLVANVIE